MFKKSVGIFIIATFLSAGSASIGMYFFVNQRINTLEEKYSSQQMSLDDVNQLQANHTENLTQLSNRLDNVDRAVFNYVEEINQKNHKLTTKIEQTNQAVSNLLTVVERKEQVMGSLIPAGTIIAYAGNLTIEIRQQLLASGWLVCDGQTYTIEDYPELYQAIKGIYGQEQKKDFQVPDFRGVFLRGLDLDKQIDPKRTLGSYQADSYKRHKHEGQLATAGLHDHEGTTTLAGRHQHRLMAQGYWFTSKLRNERRAITGDIDDNQEYWTSANGEHLHGIKIEQSGAHDHALTIEESGIQETRPKNYPVIYLIKF